MLKSYKANSKISFNFYFLVLANKQIGFQGCGFCCWLVAPSQDTFWVLSNWLASIWGISQVGDSAIKLFGADIRNILHFPIKPTTHFTDFQLSLTQCEIQRLPQPIIIMVMSFNPFQLFHFPSRDLFLLTCCSFSCESFSVRFILKFAFLNSQ